MAHVGANHMLEPLTESALAPNEHVLGASISETAMRPNPQSPSGDEMVDGRWVQGSVGLPLCATAHPLHPRISNMFGSSTSEATMRPHPRSTCASKGASALASVAAQVLGWGRGAAMGRGHASLLADADTYHSKPLRNVLRSPI